MIANYGYTDGSGSYYITIDTAKCASCPHQRCVDACPERMFAVEADDYDELAAMVKAEFRNQIKYKCAACKPVSDKPPLPCVTACTLEAIAHSW